MCQTSQESPAFRRGECQKSYSEKLSAFIENNSDDADKPLISDEELTEAYETIREISTTFDYDSLQFILNSLEEYRLPESEIKKFQALKDAASRLDWENIIKLI